MQTFCRPNKDLPRAVQTMFEVWLQGMAGNIVHAIASTNATIAGMIVVEALKILAGMPQACRVSISDALTEKLLLHCFS